MAAVATEGSQLRRLAAAPRRAVQEARDRVVYDHGSQVLCPWCGGRFRRFRPFGVQRRPNANCGTCGSRERHRLLWLYLHERTDLYEAPLRVLHFAPEREIQRQLRALPLLDYVSADLFDPSAMSREDITALSFDDSSFDAVLCSHVLEEVPDDRRAMSELYRVLRPGGWALIQSWVAPGRGTTVEDLDLSSPAERQRAFGWQHNVRAYGEDLADRLSQTGFETTADPTRERCCRRRLSAHSGSIPKRRSTSVVGRARRSRRPACARSRRGSAPRRSSRSSAHGVERLQPLAGDHEHHALVGPMAPSLGELRSTAVVTPPAVSVKIPVVSASRRMPSRISSSDTASIRPPVRRATSSA